MAKKGIGWLICCAMVLQLLGGVAMAQDTSSNHNEVVAIDWGRFADPLPTDETTEIERQILQNSNKYALNTWWNNVKKYAAQTGDYLNFGGTDEKAVRPATDEALALATSIKLGLYSPEVTGVSTDEAIRITSRLIASVAYRHRANSGSSGWGGPKDYVPTKSGEGWQTALWAASNAYAGWLMWDDLSELDRQYVRNMIEYEANRFLNFTVPYYADRDGNLVYPGDTKAEENSWNAYALGIAMAMMPNHQNYQRWLDKYAELMISAFAKPSDLTSGELFHGKALSQWLNGSNILEDGTLYNHSQIHPDYMVTNGSYFFIVAGRMLAGQPLLKAEFLNNGLIYYALSDLKDENGKTIYQPDGTIYYQKLDWGNGRRMNFALFDCVANLFGFDQNSSTPASEWEYKHASLGLAQQQRFTDGRTYDPAKPEDSFHGAEEIVASRAANIFLIKFAMAQSAIDKTVFNGALDTRTPQQIADGITQLSLNDAGDAVVMPAVPEGFTVAIDRSGNPAVIDLQGRVIRQKAETQVELVLRVIKTEDQTSALTAPISVTVPSVLEDWYRGNLLSESFDHYREEDWMFRSAAGGAWGVQQQDGGPALRQADTGANKARAVVGDRAWTDYQVEFDLYIHSAQPSSSGTGFYFRYNDKAGETDVTDAYYVSFYNGNSTDSGAAIKLIKYAGSTTATVMAQKDYNQKPLSFDTWHKIKTVANGNHLELWVDGQLVFEVEDEEQSNPFGRIALYAHRADVSFDNIRVTGYGLEVDSLTFDAGEDGLLSPNETAAVNAVLTNTGLSSPAEASLILALYDREGAMLDTDVRPVSLAAGAKAVPVTAQVTAPNREGCFLKAFLWTDLDTCRPLYPVEQFGQSGME